MICQILNRINYFVVARFRNLVQASPRAGVHILLVLFKNGMCPKLIGASIAGAILNFRRRRSGFLLWVGCNLVWIVLDFRLGLISQGVLFGAFAILALYGYTAWRKEVSLMFALLRKIPWWGWVGVAVTILLFATG